MTSSLGLPDRFIEPVPPDAPDLDDLKKALRSVKIVPDGVELLVRWMMTRCPIVIRGDYWTATDIDARLRLFVAQRSGRGASWREMVSDIAQAWEQWRIVHNHQKDVAVLGRWPIVDTSTARWAGWKMRMDVAMVRPGDVFPTRHWNYRVHGMMTFVPTLREQAERRMLAR